MKRGLLGSLLMLALTSAQAGDIFNVRAFGAKGDGETSDTAAINRAMEAAALADWSQVYIPPGRYVSGTIHLRSRVTLLIDPAAIVVGTTNLAEYQHFRPPEGTPEARFPPEWHRAMFLGEKLDSVQIVGGGMIDGNRVFDPKGEERMRGPHTILLGHSKNISIRDVSIRDSANYAVMLEDCSDVDIRNIRVTGGWDGVHFRGWPDRYCRNVTIAGCQFYTGDDAIAGRYWDFVTITSCIINSSCNGIRLIGPATNFTVTDCLFQGPGLYPHRTSNRTNMLAAIALQPGGWDATEGPMDRVLLADLTIQNVTTPFHISVKGKNTAGRINIQRVSATGIYRAPVTVESWTDAPITNVVFRDVTMEFEGGGTEKDAAIEIRSPGVDARKMPSWGFFGRNVEQLTLDNVRARLNNDDARPAAIFDDVERIRTGGFECTTNRAATPIVLKNGSSMLLLR